MAIWYVRDQHHWLLHCERRTQDFGYFMARDRIPCFIDYRAIDAATNHQAQCGIGWAGRSREKRVFAEDSCARANFAAYLQVFCRLHSGDRRPVCVCLWPGERQERAGASACPGHSSLAHLPQGGSLSRFELPLRGCERFLEDMSVSIGALGTQAAQRGVREGPWRASATACAAQCRR
jgi:hypothetical protein